VIIPSDYTYEVEHKSAEYVRSTETLFWPKKERTRRKYPVRGSACAKIP
jgi:hypothetical protein